MIGNVFEDGTGKWLAWGKKDKPQVKFYTDQGHHFVEGESGMGPNWLKYENGRVVPDADRIAEDEARRNAKGKRRQDAKTAYAQLKAAVDDETTVWTNPVVVRAAFSRCLTMFEYVAASLQNGDS